MTGTGRRGALLIPIESCTGRTDRTSPFLIRRGRAGEAMKTLCISHVKDVDGISSAAIVRAATGAEFRLTDYDQMFEELETVPDGTESLVICDLGIDASKLDRFSEILTGLSGRMEVLYIDHHYLSQELRASLQKLPIRLVHDVNECASMLTYLTIGTDLPRDANYLALFGAVTDYMDSSPVAAKMMERFDRQYVLLESTLLSYAVAGNGGEYGYVESLVKELAAFKKPHEIQDVKELAIGQLEVVTSLAQEVGEKGSQLGRLAYMETEENSTGNVAKLLLGAFDVVVGVSYKKKGERAELSLRGTSECRVHLGQAISGIAAGHGGNGGGHQKAAGCSIPFGEVMPVLRELSAVV
jgi:single-stranded DNA-specific DHH superfamily exonuclease